MSLCLAELSKKCSTKIVEIEIEKEVEFFPRPVKIIRTFGTKKCEMSFFKLDIYIRGSLPSTERTIEIPVGPSSNV